MASLQKYTTGGKRYWRIVESYRDAGRPKVRLVKHLGSVADILALLEGNERSIEVHSVSHGDVQALVRVADELGVASVVDAALSPLYPDGIPRLKGLTPGEACVLIAIGRACRPTSKRGWAEWAQGTSLPELLRLSRGPLTSAFFWEQMDRIPVEVLPGIEEELVSRALQEQSTPLDLLLYDTTNFFTHIASDNQRCTVAQRGKNKQKRIDLRQVGLALMVSGSGRIPLWHQVYRGNLTDVTVFSGVLTRLRKRLCALSSDVSQLTVVYDRGNNSSRSNQSRVDASEFHYVAALTPAHHGKLVEEANSGLEPVEIRHGETLSAWRDRREVWDADRTVVVFVSETLRQGQIRGLHQHLDKRVRRLSELKESLDRPKAKRRDRKRLEGQIASILSGQQLSRVIDVAVLETEPGRLTIEFGIDTDAYSRLVEHEFGRRILITDQHQWTTRDIILAYRGQSEVEETFKTLKNPFHLAVRPQYHWTDQKIEVHAFCCVLGYLLARVLHNRVLETTSFQGSVGALLDQLRKVRRATVLETAPSKPGRPRVRQVLDAPNDPTVAELIRALGIAA